MTRETRIALLVGLAFIVLFGLVLGQRSLNLQNQSNGTNVARTAPGTPVVPVNVPAPAPTPAVAPVSSPIIPPVAITPPMTSSASPEVASAGNPPPARALPAVAVTPAPGPATVVRANNPTPAPTGIASPMPPSRMPVPVPTEVASGAKAPAVTSPSHASVPVPADLVVANRTPAVDSSAKLTLTNPEPAVATPAAATGSYEVQPGDTLYKIAGKLYGKGHEAEYLKIYKANQGKIPDSFALTVGQKLAIPDAPAATAAVVNTTLTKPTKPGIKELAAGKKDATITDLKNAVVAKPDSNNPPTLVAVNPETATLGTPSSPKIVTQPKATEVKPADLKPKAGSITTVATAAPAAAPTGKKYTIKSGDSLAAIARSLMGDSSKAAIQKIMEANKDRLKDPNQLKVGTELRIPQA